MPDQVTATLLRVAELTPRMLRLTFAVPGCEDRGRPDEWLQVFFGEPGDHEDRRNYTVRAVRPDETDVDFALHEGGLAATWAREATPGDELVWIPVEGYYNPPADAPWQLIVGDLPALPAIGRILEELPAGARATVVCRDRRSRGPPAMGDRGRRRRALAARPRRGPPEPLGRGRAHVPGAPGPWLLLDGGRDAHGTRRAPLSAPRARSAGRALLSLTGYWLARSEEWLERYQPIADDMAALWEHGEATGRDHEELMDDYEAALDRVGL